MKKLNVITLILLLIFPQVSSAAPPEADVGKTIDDAKQKVAKYISGVLSGGGEYRCTKPSTDGSCSNKSVTCNARGEGTGGPDTASLIAMQTCEKAFSEAVSETRGVCKEYCNENGNKDDNSDDESVCRFEGVTFDEGHGDCAKPKCTGTPGIQSCLASMNVTIECHCEEQVIVRPTPTPTPKRVSI